MAINIRRAIFIQSISDDTSDWIFHKFQGITKQLICLKFLIDLLWYSICNISSFRSSGKESSDQGNVTSGDIAGQELSKSTSRDIIQIDEIDDVWCGFVVCNCVVGQEAKGSNLVNKISKKSLLNNTIEDVDKLVKVSNSNKSKDQVEGKASDA